MKRPVGSLPRRLALMLAVAMGVGLTLSGCAKPRSGDPETTGSIALAPDAEPIGSAAEWTDRYRATPDDPSTALSFAKALRADGRASQAVDVLQRTMVQHPNDPVISSAYGKALAEKGDFDAALRVIRAANSPRTPDWRLTSAEGAIQDQMGNPQEARRLYELALKLVPDEPTVLNNYGLSFTLTNELPQAERLLRRAAQSPRADGRIRQNLALVVGLQGRFEEARQIATQALPKEQAEANVAYLKGMLTQANTWKQIEKTGKAG